MKTVGIIGCGGIAQVHAWALSQLKGVELIACADPKSDRALALSERYTGGSARVYDSLSHLLAGETPDVIHICTPHYLHVPLALEALGRDIHVFMEKPPAITPEEFRCLDRAGQGSRGELGFCFQNRYNRTTRALEEVVLNHKLGELTGGRAFVTWRRDEAYYSDDWHGRLDTEGGGVLINQAIHTLDLLLRFLGAPSKVDATMSNHHLPGVIQVEDTLEAWMEFPGGKRACFYASNGYAADAPNILELTFERGQASLMGQSLLLSPQGEAPVLTDLSEEPGVGKSYWGNGHLACIRDFYRHLEDRTPFPNDLEGVRTTIETTLRIYESARRREGR